MSELTARNLTLAYENNTIIENLSIHIPDRKITALVGPNGCGKSTLLRGLSRLLKAKDGGVVLDKEDPHQRRLSSRPGPRARRSVAVRASYSSFSTAPPFVRIFIS